MRLIGIAFVLLFVSTRATAAVVYDNLANTLAFLTVQTNVEPIYLELADLLDLASTERTLAGMEVRFQFGHTGSTSTVLFDLHFRVFEIDSQTGLPGTMIAESSQYNQQVTGLSVVNWYMDMPSAQLGDTVIAGVRIENFRPAVIGLSTARVGVAAADPPVVGWSSNEFMFRYLDEFGWGELHVPPYGNMGIRLHAVPEPATAFATLVGLSIVALRRCRK